MYLPIPSQPTCAQAWLTAATAINEVGREAYNVIVDIAEPLTWTTADQQITDLVHAFTGAFQAFERSLFP
jgi:hypothetical protein